MFIRPSRSYTLGFIIAVGCVMPGITLADDLHANHHSATTRVSQPDPVMTVTAPDVLPLQIITNLKTPRQPVPASDGSDYLKTIAGFSQIRNGGTNGDPVFRGLFGSRLRILTNNGEMLGACPARMDAPTSYISPENFDALTLIKGPETVLWGPGNSAGTLRFDREPPQFEQRGIKGNASLLAASNNRFDENADISLGNSEGYLRLTSNISHAGDYQDGNGKNVPAKWNKWNADIALGWTPDQDLLLELSAGKGDSDARYAGRNMDGSQFKRESLGVRFEKSNIDEVLEKFEASAYYNYANHIMDNYSLRSAGGSAMGSMRPGMMVNRSMTMPMAMQLDRRVAGGRIMGTWLWQDIQLQTGADMQTDTHRSKGHRGWVKNARFGDYGLFSELTWDATLQSKIIGGARLDHAHVNNYTKPNEARRSDTLSAGFIRLEQRLSDRPLALYAGLGYTERFPDYWELFSPKRGSGGSAFDTVKTEKTTQLDIGAHYSSDRFAGWASAYLGRINDYILFRYDADNAYNSEANNINATIMGGETGFSYQLSDRWKTDASLNYSRAKNSSNHKPLPQIPPLEVRLGLNWEAGNWSSGSLLRLVSRQNRIAENEGNVVGKDFKKSAGFAVFSVNMAYNIAQNIKLSSGIDNLFNTAYSEHLNLAGNSTFGYAVNSSVNEPGRTWWGKINVTF